MTERVREKERLKHCASQRIVADGDCGSLKNAVMRQDWRGIIAANAPAKEQDDANLRESALEALTSENDALYTAFGIDAFGLLRRIHLDLTL